MAVLMVHLNHKPMGYLFPGGSQAALGLCWSVGPEGEQCDGSWNHRGPHKHSHRGLTGADWWPNERVREWR